MIIEETMFGMTILKGHSGLVCVNFVHQINEINHQKRLELEKKNKKDWNKKLDKVLHSSSFSSSSNKVVHDAYGRKK